VDVTNVTGALSPLSPECFHRQVFAGIRMQSSRGKRRLIGIVMLSAAVAPIALQAHHSGSEYDFDKTIEIAGTLVDVKWQNPHVRLSVRSANDAQGKSMTWDIEGSSLSVLRRTNATPEKLKTGDKVRVAGFASKKAPNRMLADNVLLADGTELVFMPGGRPRWASTAVGSRGTWFDAGTAEKASAGIFRVWSTKLDASEPLWQERYPLTEAARKALQSWDPVNDSVARDCEPKGMPTIMEQPYPLEFVKQSDTILLRLEEYDTVRTIHLSDKVSHASLPTHRLGRSTGRWEGNTLVVKTDGITWPYIDPNGTPLSPAATLVERFTPTVDGARLEYSVVITDPRFLTEPVKLTRSWVARPNEAVKPYRCGRS
jgi:hypothetical protein